MQRNSNRISQTEENEDVVTPRQQYEGGEDQNGPHHSSSNVQGSVMSANIINFEYDDDLIRGESDVSIDSKIVAAEDRKELVERRVWAILGRMLAGIFCLAVNGFVVLAVGYFYYNDAFYNSQNNYTWVAVFFGAQIIGFLIIDMIIILIMACLVKGCSSKVCLARVMRDSLYIYEDYRYVTEFSQQGGDVPPDIIN